MFTKFIYSAIALFVMVSAPFAPAKAEFPYKINFTNLLYPHPQFIGNSRVEFDDTVACFEPKHLCVFIKKLAPGPCKEVGWKGEVIVDGRPADLILGSVTRTFGGTPENPVCDSIAPIQGDSVVEVRRGTRPHRYRLYGTYGNAEGWDPMPPL